ncbi:unnamed protein product [Caenorhabditis brenneri]
MYLCRLARSDSCTPLDNTTLVFAYSTDFDPTIVNGALGHYVKSITNISPHYTAFAGIRFDTRDESDFEFGSNFTQIAAYVQSHQPDASLGFNNNYTGSDVLRMIDRFLDNKEVPACGSKFIIYVKRYPNETDISSIVAKLRKYHSYLVIFATNNPSGGSQQETLYDLATKTNGLCGFDTDTNLESAANYVSTCFHPYLAYAANPQVSETGSIQLQPFLGYDENDGWPYWLSMSFQDNGPISTVQSVLWSWSSRYSQVQMGYNDGCYRAGCYGNQAGTDSDFHVPESDMTLDYRYSDTKTRRLQLRINARDNIQESDWLPYDD